MKYPVELLPNPAYKVIDCDLSQNWLLRFIETVNMDEIWDAETNTVRVNSIYSPSIRVSDLSMSLLGVYAVKHIFLEFTSAGKQKYMHECPPDEAVNVPGYEADYFLNEDRHYWCIQHLRLANETFEFRSSEDITTATCFVVHTPMRWNFWHFSLRWKLKEGVWLEELNDSQRKKVAKKLETAVKSRIAKFAIIKEPVTEVLPKHCYCKN